MTSTDALKTYLADTYTLLLKTHAFHWNVEGARFYDLHQLFEVQYKDLFEAVDAIAERIRALGEYAPGGLKAYTKMTSISDPEENMNSDVMLHALISDHKNLAERAKKGIKAANQADDDATADLLVSRVQQHEKQVWMMTSILDDASGKSSTTERNVHHVRRS